MSATLCDIDIDLYLATYDSRMGDPRSTSAHDTLGDAAVQAFAHIVDDCPTLDDLAAYRAWITYQRMTGMSEHDLKGAVAVAAVAAYKLGVA